MGSSSVSANSVLDLIKNRRTYYVLNNDLVVSKDRIQEIVKESLFHVPSPYNCQSTRVVVLFDEHHHKLWDIAIDVLKPVIPENLWDFVLEKLNGFRAATATVMFFEDQDSVKEMQSKYPFVADKFTTWTSQCDAMLQFTLWTALEAEGFGCNLQHYNPLIDAKVSEAFKIPDTWKLDAQLVLGGRAETPGDKEFMSLEQRYKVFGA